MFFKAKLIFAQVFFEQREKNYINSALCILHSALFMLCILHSALPVHSSLQHKVYCR